ncbi:MAG TPA: nucleoside hydrolase [Candidatus Kryptonia bacterium]
MIRLLIDTDAGVDDSLAIMYAASCPEASIEMISTVSGNVHVDDVTQNVLLLRELLHADFPVYMGAPSPRSRELLTAPEVHGGDGVGNYRKSNGRERSWCDPGNAADMIVESARKHGRKLTIVSIGPMTNIADAVSLDADSIRNVGRIIQMGGVTFGYGNTTTFTEFNIAVDPEAAAFVLEQGIFVRFVSLDLTELLFLKRRFFNQVLRRSTKLEGELKNLISQAVEFYMQYHKTKERLDGCFLHDPIAIAAALNGNWFRFIKSRIAIETKGVYTSGMTIADLRGNPRDFNSEIAVAFDAAGFMRDFILKVFGVSISRKSVRENCLSERFVSGFSNMID